jgi:hypothetical protein
VPGDDSGSPFNGKAVEIPESLKARGMERGYYRQIGKTAF